MIIDNHNHIGIEIGNYTQFQYPYAQTLEDMRAKAQATPVTHWLVFPCVSYPTTSLTQHIQPTSLPQHSHTPYALANQNMLKEIQTTGTEAHRYLPVAILDPSREVEAQIQNLRELREKKRFYALKIQGTILKSKVTDLLEGGSAFLELAAEWNCPFLIHSSIHPDDIWSQAKDILKVAEARPDIRFLLAHSCRFHKPSLDRVNELPNTWFDCSAHCIHCQLAVKNLPAVAEKADRFPSDYSNPATVLRDLAEAYPSKLIWGSDSPYYSWIAPSGELPETLISSYPKEWACVDPLPSHLKTAITATNTLNWIGLHENEL